MTRALVSDLSVPGTTLQSYAPLCFETSLQRFDALCLLPVHEQHLANASGVPLVEQNELQCLLSPSIASAQLRLPQHYWSQSALPSSTLLPLGRLHVGIPPC